MAFKAGVNKKLPDTLEGIYLFPMWWFAYGLDKGFLEIDDTRKFANSIQGSVLSWLWKKMKKSKFDISLSDHRLTLWEDDSQCDLWVEYKPGGEIVMIYYPTTGYQDELNWPNSSNYDRLTVMGMDTFSKLSINGQKTINSQYISLFAGCGVTIKDRVWFTELTNLF